MDKLILKHYTTVQIDENTEQSQIYEKLTKLELAIKDNQNPSDSPSTEQELNKLQALKSMKACGPDGVLNEMLKNTRTRNSIMLY